MTLLTSPRSSASDADPATTDPAATNQTRTLTMASQHTDAPHRQQQFDTPGPIALKVEVRQGDITVRAGEVTTTTVRLLPSGKKGAALAEAFTVEARGDTIVVLAPKEGDGTLGFGSKGSVDVEIELPTGSHLEARTGSGDVVAEGRLGRVDAASGSGDLTFHDVESAELKSGSGDITVRAATRGVRAKTGSGDITLESATEGVDATSGSGDITLRRVGAEVRAKSGSGDIGIGTSFADLELMTGTGDVKLGAVHGGQVRAKTGTGDVSIAIALGVAAYLDLNTVTGDVKIDLEDADGPDGAEAQAGLTVHSGSGDIRITRAQGGLS